MHNTHDASLFPLPRFSDTFHSYFDEQTDLDIGSNVVSYSPLTKNVSKFIKSAKAKGRDADVRTLNLEDLQRYLWKWARPEDSDEVRHRIYYPSRDVPETTWKNLRLLQVDFCQRDDGMTALLWAAHIGDREGIKRLLSSGADVNRQLQNGNTVLMETIAGNPCTRHACVDILLDHGVGINLQNKVGHTAFTAASSIGDARIVESMFLRYRTKININHKTKHGSSALMLAIAGNHKDIVNCLLSHDPDILQEDKDHLTALCWAQVLNPSLAGLLSLRLGLKNALADYIRRRVELLQARNDNLEEVFGLFYHITFLLLNFDVARRVLIKDGVLRTLTFHPIWDKMKLVERGLHEKGFYQMLPWFIALGCSMVRDDNYSIQKFTSNGVGQLYLEEINESLGSALDDQDTFMAHSLMIPLMAREAGRQFIVDTGFNYRNILDLFTDLDDILTEKSAAVYRCFSEYMKTPLEQYSLKRWKKVLGVEVQKPMTKSVMERLKEVYIHFEVLREEARKLKSSHEQEDLEMRQAREKEMLKSEKNRAKRTNRRERRRISFDKAGQNAVHVDKEMYRVDRTPVEQRRNDTLTLDQYTQIMTDKSTTSPQKNLKEPLRPVRASNTPSPTNKHGIVTIINDKTGQTTRPKSSLGSEPAGRSISKGAEARVALENELIQPFATAAMKPVSALKGQTNMKSAIPKKTTPTIPMKTTPTIPMKTTPTVPMKTTPQKPKPSPKPKTPETKPVEKEKTPKKKLPKRLEIEDCEEIVNVEKERTPKKKLPKRLEIEDCEESVNQQIEDDYLLAVDIQSKLDTGVDMVDEKTKEKDKAEGEEANFNENKRLPNLPRLPKNAVHASTLERQVKTLLHVTKSDEGRSTRPVAGATESPIQTIPAKVKVDVEKSAGDGVNVKKPLMASSWQKRSKRWSGLLEQLINLPRDKREKCGSIHFTFADPSLYLAKGSEGTVVSVGIRDDGTEVAVKRMLKSHFKFICNELRNLRLPQLETGNFVQYKDYAEDNYFGYLALELCEYTLDEYIEKLKHENQLQAHSKRLVKELFEGLKTLHEAKILHRDLKPRNVLIDIRGTLKLADFGVSKKMNEDESTIYQTSAMGTRCWRPTETLRSLQRGLIVPFRPSSDIQVAGMIAYFIISGGRHPYGQDHAECEINIRESKPVALSGEKDDILLGLLAGTLHFDPSKRRTAEQILLHPYFWSIERKFEFLQKVKRMSEIRMNVRCQVTRLLNTAENWIGCQNWMVKQDTLHLNQMQYHGFVYTNTVVDFLSFIIDTDEMFSELPVHLQTLIWDPRKHFITAYPRLLMAVYEIVRDTEWKDRRLLVDFFKPKEQEL